jgi:hypothetical protein
MTKVTDLGLTRNKQPTGAIRWVVLGERQNSVRSPAEPYGVIVKLLSLNEAGPPTTATPLAKRLARPKLRPTSLTFFIALVKPSKGDTAGSVPPVQLGPG